jgi:glyoxylase-like metal-dependent hydrolase (beta-lactamase superfamily II)
MSEIEVDVLVGGLRRTTSTVVSSAGRCLLVDPGYFPREIAELERLLQLRGSLKALAFTHGHWEHIMGGPHFPGASVWASDVLVGDIEDLGQMSRDCLEQARRFDDQWWVDRPEPADWPESLAGLSDGQRRRLGDVTVQALLVPGHSPDSMALLVEEAGLLIAGDYLSPCDIPVVDDFDAYYAALHRFAGLLDKGVSQVIPGHGWKMEAQEAQAVVRDDLSYLYQLMFFRDSGDLASAPNMLLPRLNENKTIREHHDANCHRLGLE